MKHNQASKPKQDMGTGSVKKLMVQMAVPAIVGQVINLLYNVVDRIYKVKRNPPARAGGFYSS